MGFRHHRRTAFLTANNGANVGHIVQRIKRCQKTLARHTENMIRPVATQCINQDATPCSCLQHCGYPSIKFAMEYRVALHALATL